MLIFEGVNPMKHFLNWCSQKHFINLGVGGGGWGVVDIIKEEWPSELNGKESLATDPQF